MKRINITNEHGESTGYWFNSESSKMYVKEETRWDGQNWVSKATGNQFHHEALHYTKSGRFVLNRWSDYQGSKDLYIEISGNEVVDWLIKNEFQDLDFLDGLPQKIKESVLAELEAREI